MNSSFIEYDQSDYTPFIDNTNDFSKCPCLLSTVWQIRYASVDLELHTEYVPGGAESIHDIDQRVGLRIQVIPLLPEDRFLCSFSHIFAGYLLLCFIIWMFYKYSITHFLSCCFCFTSIVYQMNMKLDTIVTRYYLFSNSCFSFLSFESRVITFTSLMMYAKFGMSSTVFFYRFSIVYSNYTIPWTKEINC